ncbi:hypothetical protein SporoP37_11795 [Sporosarcina sp. P37]|uniref:DUF2529 family protein n=1 Tax=unclassified Sporosarcina TaxID=2647733 RepID=UPI0009BFA225|nr:MULTISPECIES: DUF2529 family protein [unclassified Sporosarcina]ARD48769.1 hypothetical protein SporoP33_11405 [Sporosarcina sp. P33]ARK25272.1 hypothetical protein SporoP37_11795 [Sporosarcina sp. P37]PID17851.1 DUF2529 domain-containing protein [Sporosarcina sp. P35]
MKILTTQIRGLLERIAEGQEQEIEDTARLLAQALVGEGRIILAAFGEMEAIASTALEGAEPMNGAVRYTKELELTTADRVWLLARNADHPAALELAEQLSDQFVPFAALAADKDTDDNELSSLAFAYISTGLKKGLIPGPTGERIVQPHALAALFAYEAVKLAMDDMLADEDDL